MSATNCAHVVKIGSSGACIFGTLVAPRSNKPFWMLLQMLFSTWSMNGSSPAEPMLQRSFSRA